MNETPVVFECAGDSLVGVISEPAQRTDTAVLIIVGGPQYRVGSHRQFVQLARTLAAAGTIAMRFDVRGMGDAAGQQRSFEAIDDDIGAALDALLRHQPGLRHIVLWGLCDGASAALLYLRATQDQRVTGLVLVNPWVRSEVTLARARVKHYYFRRVFQKQFWLKLFRGGVALGALTEFLRSARTMASASGAPGSALQTPGESVPLPEKMLLAAQRFPGQVLVALSGNDYTAKEFIELVQTDRRWFGLMSKQRFTRVDFADADHTFSQRDQQVALESATLAWLESLVRTA